MSDADTHRCAFAAAPVSARMFCAKAPPIRNGYCSIQSEEYPNRWMELFARGTRDSLGAPSIIGSYLTRVGLHSPRAKFRLYCIHLRDGARSSPYQLDAQSILGPV